MPRIFITGVTGFVGGDALYTLIAAHPDYTFSALVRSESSANEITNKYPNIKIVLGDLDDIKTIETASEESDVVLNLATSNHIASVKAIVSGLKSRESGGTLIQISGASILSHAEISRGTFGVASSQILDDIIDLPTIADLTSAHPSRPVDSYLLTLASSKVKTAIVNPACIYGAGRGPGNVDSVQIPELVKATLKCGEGIVPGPGESRWGMVHVADLSAIFLALLDNSTAEGNEKVTEAWGKDGYYFASTDEKSYAEIVALIVNEAYTENLIKKKEMRSIGKTEMEGLVRYSTLFGISARIVASRAKKVLGWKGKAVSVEQEIVRVVQKEAWKNED